MSINNSKVEDNTITIIKNNVCLIKMNRPDIRNPIHDMFDGLMDTLEKIRDDDQVKAVILTGAERVFSAGGNLKAKRDVSNFFATQKRVKTFHKLLFVMRNLTKPIIAAVNGVAAGAGSSLALACDMVIASRSASFIQSFVKVGALPDMGEIYFLTKLLGPHRAKELMMLGDRISAEKAHQIGLINEVVNDDDLLAVAYSIANQIVAGPSLAIGMIKQLVNQSENLSLEDLLELEAFGQGACFQTEDFKEGVSAFIEKRTPIFKGK
ncbi:enoyl-CoA hydratase/isomerase family protein [Gottfriedia acidiceleris]|uniref:Enoyl-CoA hydratase-related protein n=1 Tax=Gottfriedia acidiceleris TaxID=371036 RepID=A0ABY4JQ56_9BACI|nr:enoyl-CoA hydratase-related protein [Gottfriedia acidiceleris]UPM55225.1 enoyl-CoA hydratase-related protein [Gottfriedia acidiceleris]